jgi:hypothetical protein
MEKADILIEAIWVSLSTLLISHLARRDISFGFICRVIGGKLVTSGSSVMLSPLGGALQRKVGKPER